MPVGGGPRETQDRRSPGLLRNMTPLQHPPTLTSAVIKHIRDAILRGEHPPGTALPEIPLARRLATSRGTVREALRALSDLGLIEIHPRRGAVVSILTPQKAQEIFSLRALLEPHAVRLAIAERKIRSEDVRAMRAAFAWLERCAQHGDPFELIEADMNFHWTICAPCQHELLMEQLGSLQVRTRQFILYTKLYRSDANGEVASHAPILAAIESREPERAEGALRAHIIEAGTLLLARMSEMALNRPESQGPTPRPDFRTA